MAIFQTNKPFAHFKLCTFIPLIKGKKHSHTPPRPHTHNWKTEKKLSPGQVPHAAPCVLTPRAFKSLRTPVFFLLSQDVVAESSESCSSNHSQSVRAAPAHEASTSGIISESQANDLGRFCLLCRHSHQWHVAIMCYLA